MPEYHHTPVLLSEIISMLRPRWGGVYVDCTLGSGAMSEQICEAIGPSGVLVGIDRDSEAIGYAGDRLARFGNVARLVQGNFRDYEAILARLGIAEVDGVIADFGVSSRQLDGPRGFSFSRDERLDMRMGRDEQIPDAAQIIATLSVAELTDVIRRYGEERYARKAAEAIVAARQREPIVSTGQLSEIIRSAIGFAYRNQDIHPSTRVFMSLRIRTNDEIDAIEEALPQAIRSLKSGARICAISFHSLEDRIVKSVFRKYAGQCVCDRRAPECRCGAVKMLDIITRRPIVPTPEEIAENPRSRSAKLRCAERL